MINAGDGKHEHPTQGLLDLLTFATASGNSPESRSASAATCSTRAWRARNIWGLKKMGARSRYAGRTH